MTDRGLDLGHKANAKASTFAIRTSQPHKAKIAKELALPTHHDRQNGQTNNKWRRRANS